MSVQGVDDLLDDDVGLYRRSEESEQSGSGKLDSGKHRGHDERREDQGGTDRGGKVAWESRRECLDMDMTRGTHRLSSSARRLWWRLTKAALLAQ